MTFQCPVTHGWPMWPRGETDRDRQRERDREREWEREQRSNSPKRGASNEVVSEQPPGISVLLWPGCGGWFVLISDPAT